MVPAPFFGHAPFQGPRSLSQLRVFTFQPPQVAHHRPGAFGRREQELRETGPDALGLPPHQWGQQHTRKGGRGEIMGSFISAAILIELQAGGKHETATS